MILIDVSVQLIGSILSVKELRLQASFGDS